MEDTPFSPVTCILYCSPKDQMIVRQRGRVIEIQTQVALIDTLCCGQLAVNSIGVQAVTAFVEHITGGLMNRASSPNRAFPCKELWPRPKGEVA